ncbi:hypothetical protein H6G81_34435 [Scytonema hofmannii FACHB-248]|uniref:Uncharacterized protein n=1 Tax=Scytonema hofmannii FACHB-248 TaxID=1842502 RepID=A0ABR8H1L6_9CYAN|nr:MULTISPECIES: hypothetical protein [Nostocales]MBD2609454.1 hypothetical protein [Scytonema hofmannii FACHB-248]
MIQTQLVFRHEYRFDLKKIESVIIPYLFNNDTSLIISVDAKNPKNYKSAGRIDQSLIDYPGKLIASSHVVRFGNQELEFPQKGKFQLVFYPNYYLGKTTIKVSKLILPQNVTTSFEQTTLDTLNRVEAKLDNLDNFEITEDADT